MGEKWSKNAMNGLFTVQAATAGAGVGHLVMPRAQLARRSKRSLNVLP